METGEQLNQPEPVDTLKKTQYFEEILSDIPWAEAMLNELAHHHEASFQASARVARIAGAIATAAYPGRLEGKDAGYD